MTTWLAVDTATDGAGVALHDGRAVLAERTWLSRRRHTVELAPTVAAMLAAAELSPAGLAGIAVAIGPGSYTGLRVGLALAKGLAFAADLPVVGVPTLDILAAPLSPPWSQREADLWAVFRAGRGRLVAARYPTAAAGWPDPAVLRAETVAEFRARVQPGEWVAGELEAEERAALMAQGAHLLPPAASLRRAAWLAELGRARYAASGGDDLHTLAPIYLGGPA